jgi:DNA-binding transcriptional ArsR family regulator
MRRLNDMGMNLPELVKLFQRWLYLPDPAALLVALAAYAANLLSGNPVWLLLVGAGSSGKTEILESLIKLSDVRLVGKLTEAGLLSGTSTRDRTADATGGLLRSIGRLGIIVAKDSGSILNMPNESFNSVLSALREIHDGRLIRDLGSDGGRRFEWRGKVGFIGGCTPDIDTRHAAMATMGERFTLLRMPDLDGEDQARQALENSEQGDKIRRELANAVDKFMKGLDVEKASRPLESDKSHLAALASLVSRCRSATVRDGRDREIEVVPQAEAPARLALVLGCILSGLYAIGVEPEYSAQLIQKVAFDSVPLAREKIIAELCCDPDSAKSVANLTDVAKVSSSATRRHLEDLTAYGVIEKGRAGKRNEYRLSEWAREKLERLGRIKPENSEAT